MCADRETCAEWSIRAACLKLMGLLDGIITREILLTSNKDTSQTRGDGLLTVDGGSTTRESSTSRATGAGFKRLAISRSLRFCKCSWEIYRLRAREQNKDENTNLLIMFFDYGSKAFNFPLLDLDFILLSSKRMNKTMISLLFRTPLLFLSCKFICYRK